MSNEEVSMHRRIGENAEWLTEIPDYEIRL